MDKEMREYFDEHFDDVLAQMPDMVHQLLDKVTMYVEDYPSDSVMRRTSIQDRRQLCGLYTGIPLGDRSVQHSGVLSDAIHIYREGILFQASNRRGDVQPARLREEIRITVLHELGHHFGMNEQELHDLGYG
jgi:predicted Zn-dependent protease with MMP-like domain